MSEDLRNSRVKLYCPCCEDVYLPKTCKDMDGAYFGSSFPHIFLQVFFMINQSLLPISKFKSININLFLEYMDLEFIKKKDLNIIKRGIMI